MFVLGLCTDESGTAANPVQIKIRNEAFRCFNVAARRFADRQVYYLLHKMQNDKDSVKLGATNLMRHLLNSAGSQMEDKRCLFIYLCFDASCCFAITSNIIFTILALITMGLKPLLVEEALSPRVKMSICQLCVALADHGYVRGTNVSFLPILQICASIGRRAARHSVPVDQPRFEARSGDCGQFFAPPSAT